MTSSMMGATGYGQRGNPSTGAHQRGLAPGMKHISGHHRFQQFSPEQMDLFRSLFGQVGPESFLSRLAGGEEGMFEQMEKPAIAQFEQMQSALASRFGGQGLGGKHGSAHNIAQSQAGNEFLQSLQSNRMNLQQQALRDLMGYSQMLLGAQPYGLAGKKEKTNWGDIVGKFAGAIPGAIAGYATGGPAGAAYGGLSGFGGGGSPQQQSNRFMGGGTSGSFNLPTFLGQ